jgi:hypothetical protein
MALYHYIDNLQTDRGAALVGWRVQAVAVGTASVQSIYSDTSSTPIISVTGFSNAAVSDSSGNYDFYISEGVYDLIITDVSGLFRKRIPYVDMDGGTTIRADLAGTGGGGLVGWIASGVGAIARSIADVLADRTNAKSFGAVGDGIATAEQVAINKALVTGRDIRLNPGTYLLSDAITATTPGQTIAGAGKHLTVLKVLGTFNLSATGVLVSNTGEPGIDVRDLTIQFVQPDTATRASLVAYPPAIYAQGAARTRVRDVRITGAKTGIDARGNTGGMTIEGLEISSFDYGVRLDGALDSVRINGFHHWPFGLTSNQQTIFYDATTVGIESGRADDLHISDGLFLGGGLQLWFKTTGSGTTFGNVTNCDFDTYGSVQMDGGNINYAACIWTIGNAAKQAFKFTAGYARISTCEFECSTALTNPMIQGTVSSGSAYLTVSDCLFRTTGDMKAIDLAASGGLLSAIVTGNQFVLPQNSSPANAVVNVQSGARVTFADNRANDKGTGTGNLLAVSTDDYHAVHHNAFTGWGLSFPASWTSAMVFNNSAVLQGDFANNRLVGRIQFARFTGTASGGGTATIAHGISAGNYKVIDARVGYKGGSGEWAACAATVDGTNVNVTGAGASAKVRVMLTYTETQDAW